MRIASRLVVVTAAALTVTLAGAGIASAATSGPSRKPTKAAVTSTGSSAAAPDDRLLKNAVHADLIVMQPGGGTKTVTVDRGKVVSVSDSEITLERADGVEVSKGLTPKTVFNGTPKAELEPGAAVMVVSENGAATRVVTKGAGKQALAKACENAKRPGVKRLCERRAAKVDAS